MIGKIFALVVGILFLASPVVSAVVVESQFVTLYPGEEGRISLSVENNEKFDIEDVSMRLLLSDLPFTSVGNSEKEVDDINDGDDEEVKFTLRPSTDIEPGDYSIPYEVYYYDEDDNDNKLTSGGSFGIRVSAKTELDYSVYTDSNSIVGQEGEVTFEIINRGLGKIKSISVEIFPKGYELLDKEKVFVGSVDSDDTDIVNYKVLFEEPNPIFMAKITYKDFDNLDQEELVTLPFSVYTEEEAKELGLIKQSPLLMYLIIIIVLIIILVIWKSARKRKRRNNRKK